MGLWKESTLRQRGAGYRANRRGLLGGHHGRGEDDRTRRPQPPTGLLIAEQLFDLDLDEFPVEVGEAGVMPRPLCRYAPVELEVPPVVGTFERGSFSTTPPYHRIDPHRRH